MAIAAVSDRGLIFEVTLTGAAVVWVPKDPGNADYARVLAWIAGGGMIS